jgi:gamma type small acid-soluble spore protein
MLFRKRDNNDRNNNLEVSKELLAKRSPVTNVNEVRQQNQQNQQKASVSGAGFGSASTFGTEFARENNLRNCNNNLEVSSELSQKQSPTTNVNEVKQQNQMSQQKSGSTGSTANTQYEFGSATTDVNQVRQQNQMSQQKYAPSGTKPTAGSSTMGAKSTGTTGTKKSFSSLGTEFGGDNDLRNRNNNNNNNNNR